MKILFFILTAVFTTSLTALGQSEIYEDLPQVNSTTDKVYSLSKLWSEIKYNFVYIDKLDFDLDSLYLATIPVVINTKNDVEYFTVLRKFVAMLDFRSFATQSIPHKIDSLFSIINSRAKGLIIDLRYCPGGDSNVGDHIMQYLVKADYFLQAGWQTRVANGYGRSQGNYRPEYEHFYNDMAFETYSPDTLRVNKNIEKIKCPVVIIIGKGTASAAETFLVSLYEIADRPILIGEQTEGTTGAPLLVDLSHNALAKICTRRLTFPYSGKAFFGEGIKPDIVSKPTLEDYEIGNDVVLKKST